MQTPYEILNQRLRKGSMVPLIANQEDDGVDLPPSSRMGSGDV
jgi:hypothetical protein